MIPHSHIGGYGEVRLCRSIDTGDQRAVKLINKARMTAKQTKMFQNEIEALRKLDHPNIIKLFEIFEDATNFYLVQEYESSIYMKYRLVKGGELFDELVRRKTFHE